MDLLKVQISNSSAAALPKRSDDELVNELLRNVCLSGPETLAPHIKDMYLRRKRCIQIIGYQATFVTFCILGVYNKTKTAQKECSIGIIGAGDVGTAILETLLSHGISAQYLHLSCRTQSKLAKYQEMGVNCYTNSSQLVELSHVVFVAVPPNQLIRLANEVKGSLRNRSVLVSTVAGVPANKLISAFGCKLTARLCPVPAKVTSAEIDPQEVVHMAAEQYASNAEEVTRLFRSMEMLCLILQQSKELAYRTSMDILMGRANAKTTEMEMSLQRSSGLVGAGLESPPSSPSSFRQRSSLSLSSSQEGSLSPIGGETRRRSSSSRHGNGMLRKVSRATVLVTGLRSHSERGSMFSLDAFSQTFVVFVASARSLTTVFQQCLWKELTAGNIALTSSTSTGRAVTPTLTRMNSEEDVLDRSLTAMLSGNIRSRRNTGRLPGVPI